MELHPKAPYHLSETLGVLIRGHADPTMRWRHRRLIWCLRSQFQEPVTLVATQARGPHAPVHYELYGPGAAEVNSEVAQLIGLEDDWSAFDEATFLTRTPALVRQARNKYPGVRQPATARLLHELITVTLEQKVTHVQARAAWRWLVRRYGEAAPAPAPADMRVAPTAEQWKRIPSWAWHQAGVDSARSRTIMNLCDHAAALQRLSTETVPQIRQSLLQLPGIGPWTVAEVLQRTHADADSVSVGDYHLAHHVVEALTGRRGDDAEMLQLLDPYRPQRQRVVRMLAFSSFRPSRYGPRLEIMDHRFH